jgi:hypothetical protein
VEVTAAYFKIQCCKYLPGSTGKPHGTLVSRSPKYNQEYYAVPYRLLEVKMFLKLKELLYKSSLDNSITFPGC